MGTISARKIAEALDKAKDVGLVEEPLVLGDCQLVLRNLRPDEYTAVYLDCKDLEEVEHLFAFQKAHIARSIIEVNGVDLRSVDFVEVEEPIKDPKTKEPVTDPQTGAVKIRLIKLERHAYLKRELVDTWGKETVYIAWRKFNDVLKRAEDKSKEGVTFILPEETPEDKFRRSLDDLKEAMAELPEQLIDRILEDGGLMRLSTAEELKAAMERTDQLAREHEKAQVQPEAPSPVPGPLPEAPPRVPVVPAAPEQAPRVRQATAEEIMARRTPLNQQAVEMPIPTPSAPQGVIPAGPAPQPPPAHQIAASPQASKRARTIAQMETGAMDIEEVPLPPPGDPAVAARLPAAPEEVAVLGDKGKEKVDIKAFHKIVEQGPTAGINPRFRGPPSGVR